MIVSEFKLPNVASRHFGYSHKDSKGKKITNGKCSCCGKKDRTLYSENLPIICYDCWNSVYFYFSLKKDVLNLRRKRSLSKEDVKNIVIYVRRYFKKRILLTIAATAIIY